MGNVCFEEEVGFRVPSVGQWTSNGQITSFASKDVLNNLLIVLHCTFDRNEAFRVDDLEACGLSVEERKEILFSLLATGSALGLGAKNSHGISAAEGDDVTRRWNHL